MRKNIVNSWFKSLDAIKSYRRQGVCAIDFTMGNLEPHKFRGGGRI